MKRGHVEILLWILAAAIGVLAWRSSRNVVPEADAAVQVQSPAPPEALRFSQVRLDEAAASVTRTDPFRLDRHPAPVAFSAAPDAVNGVPMTPPPPPPAPPKPALAVSGIVGPPWAALLDGVPGRDGPVTVRSGDEVGGLRIRQVGPDGVVVVGMDTIWRLSIKRTWQ